MLHRLESFKRHRDPVRKCTQHEVRISPGNRDRLFPSTLGVHEIRSFGFFRRMAVRRSFPVMAFPQSRRLSGGTVIQRLLLSRRKIHRTVINHKRNALLSFAFSCFSCFLANIPGRHKTPLTSRRIQNPESVRIASKERRIVSVAGLSEYGSGTGRECS